MILFCKREYENRRCKYCKRINRLQMPFGKYKSGFYTQYFRCKYCNKLNVHIGLELVLSVFIVLIVIISFLLN